MTDESLARNTSLKTIGHGWWIVAAGLIFSALIGGPVFYALGAFFAPIQAEYNWSYTTISGAFGLQGLVTGLSMFFGGWILDRVSPRVFALVGVLLVGGSFLALGRVTSAPAVYLVFGIMGLGAGPVTYLLFNGLLAMWFKQKLGTALAVVQIGYGLGGLEVPLVVAAILGFGWRPVAVMVGLALLILCLPLCLVLKTPNQPTPQTAVVESGPLSALRTRSYWVLLIAVMGGFTVTTTLFTHQIRAMISFGVSPGVAGAIVGIASVAGLAGRFGLGWLADRNGARFVLAFAISLLGLGVAALALVDSPLDPMLYVFGAVFGVGQGGIFLLGPMLQREFFGTQNFGTMQGLVFGPAALVSGVAPLFAGIVVDATASYRPVLWSTAAVAILVAVVLVVGGYTISRARPTDAVVAS